ncbi:hypothetical protein BST16_06775 [Mycobacterium asiaticum DSM 44297]|nr:hypothetical protein BST16_06775 [Mycobacterium asiaticum DSM 44297]
MWLRSKLVLETAGRDGEGDHRLSLDRGEQRREDVRGRVALFQDAADAAALDAAGTGSQIGLHDCNG